MQKENTNTPIQKLQRAYILMSHHFSTKLLVDALIFDSLNDFSAEPVFASDSARQPDFAMQVRSDACPSLFGRKVRQDLVDV